MITRRATLAALAASAALRPGVGAAQADYPNHPVRLVVPFPPGGGADLIARLISPHLQQSLGQPFFVENRSGAAGRIGGVGRTITELLLKQGKAVRAMVRNEDARAQALRDMGAEVVVGDLLDLDSMHRVIPGCETMCFGMSVRIPIWLRRSMRRRWRSITA